MDASLKWSVPKKRPISSHCCLWVATSWLQRELAHFRVRWPLPCLVPWGRGHWVLTGKDLGNSFLTPHTWKGWGIILLSNSQCELLQTRGSLKYVQHSCFSLVSKSFNTSKIMQIYSFLYVSDHWASLATLLPLLPLAKNFPDPLAVKN